MATSTVSTGPAAPDPQRLRQRFARNIPVYYLFYAVSGFLIWMPIWVIYLQEFRGMSLTQIATIESIFWTTVVVAEVPTGAIVDRWGRRVSLTLGGALFCLGSVVFAFSSTFVVLLAAYITIAAGVGFQASFGLLFAVLVGAGGLLALIWRGLHTREQVGLALRLNSVTKPQAGVAHSPSPRWVFQAVLRPLRPDLDLL